MSFGPSPWQQGAAFGAAGAELPPPPDHWSERACGSYLNGYEELLLRRQARQDAAVREIVREMLDYEAAQFDGAPDVDLNVSGADLVDAFTDWRLRLRAALA